MQIRPIGIDLSKTTFHLVALGASGKGAGEKEVLTKAAAEVQREQADFADRSGKPAQERTRSVDRRVSKAMRCG